jgi:hypothetical protein
MSIATTTQFWTTRWNGGDPTQASSYFGQDNTAFTIEGNGASYNPLAGEDSNGSWRIPCTNPPPYVGQFWEQPLTGDAFTAVLSFTYEQTPTAPQSILAVFDNGTHRVVINSNDNDNELRISGAGSAVIISGLDLKQAGSFEAKPIMLRITVDSGGNGKVYVNEVIEDDAGVSKVYTFTPASGSVNNRSAWGCNSGAVIFHNVYITNHGAFSPDELSTSPFVSDMLMRMAFSIVELLRNSKRFYLKNMIDDSSILYGYDVSSGMVSRLAPPTIHVVIRELSSPSFEALGGTRIDQRYKILLFITTRGTDYKNSYRTGLELMGDAFDEIYTNTGLQGNTDSLINFTASLDTKLDDDEVVCIHRIEFEYMRRLNMLHR